MLKPISYIYVALLTLMSVLLASRTQVIDTSTSGDEGVYLFTAQSVLDGNGLLSPTGEVLTIFPPGYPLLLAAISMLGVSVTTAVTIVNMIALGLLIPGTYILSRLALGGQVYPLIATTIIATSAAGYRVFSNAWTEPAFMVLMLAALILITRSIRTKSLSWPIIVTIGILVSLATSIRFVGILMVPVVILCAVFITWGTRSYLKLFALFAVSMIGFVVVGLRNLFMGVGVMGDRIDGALTMQGALEQFVRQLGVYIAPPETTSLTNFAGALLLVGIATAIWLIYIDREESLYPSALFFVVFWGGIVWSQTSTRIDVNPERLGSPAMVTVIILALYALQRLTTAINVQFSERIGRSTVVLGNLIAAVLIVFIVSANLINSLRLIS
jgi:4-amino-4-deoxy-L-arabinose transferase-like glycosyltransferase